MRFIKAKEAKARGCHVCTCSRFIPEKFKLNVKGCAFVCKHYECPYDELNGYEKYDDYLEDNGLNFYKYVVE